MNARYIMECIAVRYLDAELERVLVDLTDGELQTEVSDVVLTTTHIRGPLTHTLSK